MHSRIKIAKSSNNSAEITLSKDKAAQGNPL
jgi:hypothetical protein